MAGIGLSGVPNEERFPLSVSPCGRKPIGLSAPGLATMVWLPCGSE